MDNTSVPAPPQSGSSASSSYTPPEGRVGNLTVPHQHALDKFKSELQAEGLFVPERMDDATLLR